MTDDHTIIVGGGIVGISTAYYLAKRGAAVTVVDDGDFTTSASCGNAGIIALGHPPLPRPGLVWQGLKWMLDSTSPLYVPLRLDPALLSWMWRFRGACNRHAFERSTRLLSELGHAAGESFRTIIADENIECSFEDRGWLDVYRTTEGWEAGRHDAELVRNSGYRIEFLERDALLEREPALDPSVIGASHYVDSFSIHPGKFLRALAERARVHGATILERTAVQRLLRDGPRILGVQLDEGRRLKGARVVLAAGSWTTRLARSVGVRIPMQPGKGYHVNVPPLDPPLRTAVVLYERHVAVTPMGDCVRLAGTVELSGLNLRLRPRRVSMLTEAAAEYLPGVAGLTPSPGWCGLRPCTADGLPAIGWAPGVQNLFIATGHARMGMSLGPVTGRLTCEWVLDGHPSIKLGPMSPERFG